MTKPKVLLIGWDAADWKMFKPLLENGEAPHMEAMINNGVMGNLATLQPVLSPMLWNSIGTGKRPHKHGILGFTEVNPHTNVVGPSLSTSRTCKAIWNILSQEGYRAHVINWFASHPAEKINGSYITELYSKIPRNWDEPFQLGRDVVHPESAKEALEELRLHPSELEGSLLQMFAKDIHELDQEKDQRVRMLANLVAEAFTIHNATTHIMEHEEWDFLAVYYGCIDHFCHGFMHYHPPQMEGITDDDFRIFKDVIPNCCRLHDKLLGRLLQLAGPDTTVILCSDHGFHTDHLRPPGTPMVPAGPAIWHRDQGMILMQGPNVQKDDLVHGASLIDITPTILNIFDLPIGRDMDGRPLSEVFERPNPIRLINSWEERKGEHPDGMHDRDAMISEEESKAILDQFVALGYVDPPGDDKDEAAATTRRENNWNLARALVDAGEPLQALPVFEQLVEEMPERRDYTIAYANLLNVIGFQKEALALRRAVHDALDPSSFAAKLSRAELCLYEKDFEGARKLLEEIDTDEVDFSSAGSLAFVSRQMILGNVYMKMGDWNDALQSFIRAVEIDEDSPRSWLGVAQCYNRLGEHELAVDAALNAIGLEHTMAEAHFALGLALAKSGRLEKAVEAYMTSLHFNPGLAQAHKRLAAVYLRLGDQTGKSNQHRMAAEQLLEQRKQHSAKQRLPEAEAYSQKVLKKAEELRPFYVELKKKEEAEREQKLKEFRDQLEGKKDDKPRKMFTVVSGLPRSGTSLMMQMLQAGGMEPMTDGEREADEDNPEGYLEWEAIKKIKSQPDLMEQAEGKVTKVISMLLPELPPRYRYKVIFVTRPIPEIVASQAKMIARRGSTGADLDEDALTASLKRHRQEILKYVTGAGNIRVLPISYHRILENPDKVAFAISKFLGSDLVPHPEKMASAIREDLYRNRQSINQPDEIGEAGS